MQTTIHSKKLFIPVLIFLFAGASARAQDNVADGVQAQETKKITEMPTRPRLSASPGFVNVSAVDNVVSRSFQLLKNVDEIGAKIGAIENQLKGGIPDITQAVSQLNECSNALATMGSTSPALVEDIGTMLGNIKDLHVPIFKIPSALKNLNDARKAIQYCIGYAKYLTVNAIPVINKQINTSGQASQVKN